MTNKEQLRAVLMNQMMERRMESTGESREQALMFIKAYVCQYLEQK